MRKINSERVLVFFFCFFCLEPFVGFGLLPSDTQPTAVIIGILLLAKGFSFSMPTKLLASLYIVSLLFLLSSLILSYYIIAGLLPSFAGPQVIIKEFWAYITPVIILMATFRSMKHLDKTLSILISRSLVLFILFGFILNIFGQSYIIQLFVKRSIFEDNANGRGLVSFFPEQSYLVSTLLLLSVFMLIKDILKLRSAILIIILSISSRAGQNLISFSSLLIAYFFSFVSSLTRFPLIRRKHVVISFLLLALCLFSPVLVNVFLHLFSPQYYRISYIINNLLWLGPDFVLRDPSIMIKISGLIGALSSIVSTPLNFMPGSSIFFQPSADMTSAVSSVIRFISFNNLTTFGVGQSYGPLPKYVIDYGLFGLASSSVITFFLIAKASASKSFALRFSGFIIMFYLWIFLPLANPTIWFLFAVYLASNDENTNLCVPN